ncbi:hypothetical protein QWY75_13805 [Pontixanthobacter aestiaquae]|uniref:Uncharacterized protein n=2 Tax=Pontixanthobacter aestiaquae TaxID=1509367 RepID=A0A844ZBC4_9SPHN|nr:hypothetical protein [Pontixanthobacter aestiaquae]MDN3647281.1 hypothetical protein [Pontixanthobacter aestiaquae]MXO84413.1 hypothetical protein [Pontixanthobacter aestiaquae]
MVFKLRIQRAGIGQAGAVGVAGPLAALFYKAVFYVIEIDRSAICGQIAIGIVAEARRPSAVILVETVGGVGTDERGVWNADAAF